LSASTERSRATPPQDAFLDRGAGCVHRVIDAILALPHLDLGGTTDADHRNAAGELSQPLLQLLLVIVRRGLLDLGLDLGNSGLDIGLLAECREVAALLPSPGRRRELVSSTKHEMD
jgi:hypothetical protein